VLEILSPAGSPEGVIAAVQNGADAVYLGFAEFNACTDADNFTFDEFGRSLEYCRIRGVKTYLTLNTLASDRELPVIAHQVKEASRYGVDAVIVQDFGVMSAVKDAVPGLPLHASTRMGIHNLEGVKMAAAMGFSRINLSRQLSRKKLSHICRYAPVEIGIFIHGKLCMSYSGQCYMSGLIGNQSSNRGHCSEPCQRDFGTAGHTITYPLSLKDNCLIRYLSDIEAIGVTSILIEGRSKRPEYSALVTGLYSKAVRSVKPYTQESMRTLQKTFSRQGFTDGFYVDRRNTEMLGVREEDDRSDSALFVSTRKSYLNGEFQRVPIRFVGSVEADKPIKLAAIDDRKNGAVAYGPIPEKAFHRDITPAVLQTQLHKTAGTPFVCMGVKSTVEPGLTVPASAFNDMRQELFAEILEARRPIVMRAEGDYTPSRDLYDEMIPEEKPERELQPPLITVSVSGAEQLSSELADLCPEIIYIPVSEFDYDSAILHRFIENDKTTVAVALPRIIHDNEKKQISAVLKRTEKMGIKTALVGSIGHIQFIKNHGMEVRGDFGLNVYNSETLYVLQKLGLKSATLSFELRLAEIRELSKPIDTELITYGRLPMMITENCIVRNCTDACTCDSFAGLSDENGALYPIEPEFGCRNVLYHPKKLYMADKRRTISSLGIWAQRLSFTTENAIECITVTKRYMGMVNYTPTGYTRGMYFRGAEE